MITELHRVDHIHVVSEELQGERSRAVSYGNCDERSDRTINASEVHHETHPHIRKRREIVWTVVYPVARMALSASQKVVGEQS